jgi:signal transduction histidine kinase
MRIPLKLRFFLPLSFIIIVGVVVVTSWFVQTSIKSFNEQIEKNLELEVKTISKMFERESILKLKNVQTNLKVANHLFYQHDLKISNQHFEIIVENQQTGLTHKAKLSKWTRDRRNLFNDNQFVDSLNKILGGTITIFQRIDSGFVRIATNVLKENGSRAVGTFIPNESPVIMSIVQGNSYYGRAFVVNDWYTTAYEPIVVDNKVKGMIYVGDKEKDLDELKRILNTLNIGKSGFPFVFDKSGRVIIHPTHEGRVWENEVFQNQIHSSPSGVFHVYEDGYEKTIAYVYFDKFELFIAASIVTFVENAELIRSATYGAITVAIIAILMLLAFVYFFTTERTYHFFTALQISNKKLETAELALKHSEKLAAMGQISAGIAHELNNPLGVITMYSNIILEEIDKNDPHRKDLEIIVEQANRCKGIVGGLLNFARKSKINPQEVNAVDLVKRSLMSLVIPDSIETKVNEKVPNPIFIVDSEQMIQVLTNLEKNAVEAMPNGGKLTIGVEGDDENIVIHISDTGIGIAEENLDKLFTPFFTTKEPGKGTGLGLSLIYGIVKMHKGKIDVQSNSNPSQGKTGTTFTITIPRIS